MKGFIEVIARENGAQLLIAISSISVIEDFPNSTSRIVLKEIVEKSGVNLTVVVSSPYQVVKMKMEKAQIE